MPAAGGALLVSNHSGGMLTPDVLVFARSSTSDSDSTGRCTRWGTTASFSGRWGLSASRGRHRGEPRERGCGTALRCCGAGVPGGDYDSYRPTLTANVVDFAGRTGYVRTAVEAGVPIVPMVSIGAQETQIFLARGDSIARRLGLNKARLEILPVSVGFPFGLSVILPPNIPLPSKIVTRVLDPIDVVAEFGEDPDVAEVDLHVRAVMQAGLDELSRQRRFPVLG